VNVSVQHHLQRCADIKFARRFIMSSTRCHTSLCQIETSHSHHFCDQHRCATDACENARQPTNQYCTSHVICLKVGCQNAQYICSEPRPFCGEHWWTCQRSDCTEQDVSTRLRPCRLHRCSVSRCRQPPLATSPPLCSGHCCSAGNCSSIRAIGRSYCEAHDICGKAGCDVAKDIGNRFCLSHNETCIRPNCFERRDQYGWW
jgi:hypothetical protein